MGDGDVVSIGVVCDIVEITILKLHRILQAQVLLQEHGWFADATH